MPYLLPDCDDYEDWEEFMDDWDGNMPDGSDASDYWDDIYFEEHKDEMGSGR